MIDVDTSGFSISFTVLLILSISPSIADFSICYFTTLSFLSDSLMNAYSKNSYVSFIYYPYSYRRD